MNNQYQEHLDHEAGAQSEALNCLDEARAAIRPRSEAPIGGEGPYRLDVMDVVHCRATDAVVGEECSARMRFPTKEKRSEWIAEHAEQTADGWRRFEVIGGGLKVVEHVLSGIVFGKPTRIVFRHFTADDGEQCLVIKSTHGENTGLDRVANLGEGRKLWRDFLAQGLSRD